MMGTNHATRQAELLRFQHDPACPVLLLLMSNASGAAGLTLTCATTAFILEPPLNPGLEAQAAARIHRLGQTHPTRVDTVEDRVIAYSAWRQQQGQAAAGGGNSGGPSGSADGGGGGAEWEEGAGAPAAAEAADSRVLLRFFDLTRAPAAGGSGGGGGAGAAVSGAGGSS
ncbi:hypothetical protein MNEG_15928 [Monoraphidium neglectum]|uniref:Helicase C-terminal domain-containing protein n=1 Tax=Monoraphidium neglectum TaxID=145388 RepID=A0A0D2LJ76_9CHLO|nr:hypothetical protein MNEG_15928 [Monoraphidium neglectum]KIY92034.1 hypothetical protein MNEG_15928 [Monoraphidium neglectum]|eukprot:XP_013891054.1 hypothetical protein MNEG_15928 [Monoraphidium neglectum]